jgi:hypothetical protein
VREQVAEQLRRQHPLRRDNEDLLASLTLPVQTTRPYALWQLQELVAARAGLHVVSDCFWQPARSFDLALAKLYPEGAPDLNALAVLRAATLPTRGDVGGDLCDEKVSWEWGDAGDFLRFRDYHRDVCRDIFLSPEAVATLDGWIDAALPDDLAQGDNAAVEVALDPRQVGMVFLPLRPEQRRYGWHLIYDDPTDTRNAYRRAFREHLADVIPDERVYLLLARFSEGQWERLKTEGLTWGVDVLIEPDAHDLDLWFSTWYAYREGDEFRLREAREGEGRGWHWRVPVTSWLRFYVCREGYDPPDDLYDELALPRGVLVKPKSAARLTEAEECAIPPWVNHPALKELALPPYPGARPELIDRWRQERDGEPAVTQVVLLSPDRVDVVYDFYLHRLPRARGFPVHPRQLERPDDIAMGMVYGRPGDRRILHLYQSAEKKETKLTAHWLADCDAPPSERGE